MAEAAAIIVERAIAHLLTPHAAGGAVFSAEELPLGQYPKITSFLQKHISNCLNHDEIRTARFTSGRPADNVRSLCRNLIENDKHFIDGSRAVGELLNTLLTKNQRISPGTLAACLFRVSAGASRRLGLLKLDPTETIVQQTKLHGATKVVVWEPTDNALPSSGQDLQKCAFVDFPTGAADSDLLILDWQNRSSLEPAKFFTEGFLCAELKADEALLTQRFHSSVSRSLEDMRPKIGHKKVDAAKRLLDASLFSKKIILNSFVDSLNIPKEQSESLRKDLKASVKESFKPDEGVADRLTKKIKMSGKYGLRIAVESEHFKRIVKMGPDKRDPQYGDYREMTIRAYDFKEE